MRGPIRIFYFYVLEPLPSPGQFTALPFLLAGRQIHLASVTNHTVPWDFSHYLCPWIWRVRNHILGCLVLALFKGYHIGSLWFQEFGHLPVSDYSKINKTAKQTNVGNFQSFRHLRVRSVVHGWGAQLALSLSTYVGAYEVTCFMPLSPDSMSSCSLWPFYQDLKVTWRQTKKPPLCNASENLQAKWLHSIGLSPQRNGHICVFVFVLFCFVLVCG